MRSDTQDAGSGGTQDVNVVGPVDGDGSVAVTLEKLLAGEDLTANRLMVEWRYSGTRINSATTTTVKSGAGFLHSINLGVTAAGTITIYDNTAGSGTVLAIIAASSAVQTFFFDIPFTTGLTVVTAAASDLVVVYR